MEKSYLEEKEYENILNKNCFEKTKEFFSKNNEQLEYYLRKFVENANHCFGTDSENFFYWKGQVMGICKVIDLLGLKIDTKYWLNQML